MWMDRADQLRRLHDGPDVLVLLNAWDVASARVVERLGFPAVATTSSAVAATYGHRDGQVMSVEDMLSVVARMAAAVEVPVTADMEAGFGLSPAELARRLVVSGAAGLNYEDSAHDSSGPALVDAAVHADRVAALKDAAGAALVVNARVDTYLVGNHEFDDAVARAAAYRAAGADSIFVPGVTDEETIGRLVEAIDAPLNVLARPTTPPVPRLRELGVRRVSVGGGALRAVLGRLRAIGDSLQGDGGFGWLADG